MNEYYQGRKLETAEAQRTDERWTVAILIDGQCFSAEDGIGYILRVEAEKECLNLGRRLVDLGRA